MQGDIARAVLDGASVIGLVDGSFETTAAVWHKEILFALAEGVAVLGAASMGALRAAECAQFGMVPVGRIAKAYLHGALDDDAAVALEFGPAELGSPPLTEALVDVEATLERLLEDRLITPLRARAALDHARSLFFKHRTIDALANGDAGFGLLYRENRASQKRLDALELVARLHGTVARRTPPPDGWEFAGSVFWDQALVVARR
ncbi:MAG: TfuA domain-containing protein [Devosia sp.]|nr:TfuA domain-containing protein [Devosia sp.]